MTDVGKTTAETRRRFQQVVREAKDGPCADCGQTFHHAAMDFDHVRGTKRFNVSHAARHTDREGVLRAEIAKCDLVCSNCHRVRTWNRTHTVP